MRNNISPDFVCDIAKLQKAAWSGVYARCWLRRASASCIPQVGGKGSRDTSGPTALRIHHTRYRKTKTECLYFGTLGPTSAPRTTHIPTGTRTPHGAPTNPTPPCKDRFGGPTAPFRCIPPPIAEPLRRAAPPTQDYFKTDRRKILLRSSPACCCAFKRGF